MLGFVGLTLVFLVVLTGAPESGLESIAGYYWARPGLALRLQFVVLFLWIVVMAIHLLRLSLRPGAEGGPQVGVNIPPDFGV